MSEPEDIHVLKRERVHPQTTSHNEQQQQSMLLSLLDATTANFALTNAIWLFECPTAADVDVPAHLRHTLSTALDAYPQWCGRLQSIDVLDDEDRLPADAKKFAAHGRRFGRVFVRYGGAADVGVDFATATSDLTLDDLYDRERPRTQPLWSGADSSNKLSHFANTCDIAHALQPNDADAVTGGLRKPIMGIQCTMLACGGFVLAAKIAHPLADIAGLVYFVRDWGRVSQAIVTGQASPVLRPVFAPDQVDAVAAGDINGAQPDPALVQTALALPLHRYDWWAPPGKPPAVVLADDADATKPAGTPMPWHEWDTSAPVSSYTIHLTAAQVDVLQKRATTAADAATAADPNTPAVSKHDAVLAHVYACIVRARQLDADNDLVHCDLVLGLRAALKLGDAFMGSPIIMVDVAMPGAAACSDNGIGPIARKIRQTLVTASSHASVAAHLHTVAFERSPQRLWQAFLGQRHMLVTTWARAGLYDVDFGLAGSEIRYADGLMPNLDGMVFIKEAPPPPAAVRGVVSASSPSWTANGVDIAVSLKTGDMERLLKDPLLLPIVA